MKESTIEMSDVLSAIFILLFLAFAAGLLS